MSNSKSTEVYDTPRKDFPVESVWEHSGGGEYKIIGIELDATGYEETHQVSPMVRYEQQFNGSFPKGTIWVRQVISFRNNFTRKS